MNESSEKPTLRCSVCFDEKFWAENPLVTCSECVLTIHKACYGITEVPVGNWVCQTCESQERLARVKCELCPMKGGALKKTDTNGWAHVVCALYIPEVRFQDTRTMEPIIISRIPRDKFTKSCHICEESNQERKASYGACMNCNWNCCKVSFHVTCGQKYGLLTEEEESRDGSSVRYCGYCPTHLTRIALNDRRKTVSLPVANATTSLPLGDTKIQSNKRKYFSNNEGTNSKRPIFKSDSSENSQSDKHSDSDTSTDLQKEVLVTKPKHTPKPKQETPTTTTTTTTTTSNKQKNKQNKELRKTPNSVLKSKVHPLSRQLSKSYSQLELKPSGPDSLEKMLDKQWEQTSGYICTQGARLGEIDTLLTSLHRLQNENNELRNSMHSLSVKTDRYQSSNLYLSSLLTMHAVGQISLKIPQFKPPEIFPPKIAKSRKKVPRDLKGKLDKQRSKKQTTTPACKQTFSDDNKLESPQTCQQQTTPQTPFLSKQTEQTLNSQIEPTANDSGSKSKLELSPEFSDI